MPLELALRLERSLMLIWEQDGVEATLRTLAKGTREEVTELVVDAPVVQVFAESTGACFAAVALR